MSTRDPFRQTEKSLRVFQALAWWPGLPSPLRTHIDLFYTFYRMCDNMEAMLKVLNSRL